jgi:cytochrome c
LLARADPNAGASVYKMCAVCHTDERGAPHKVGNNLWNIIGSPKAARPDYRYSQALRAKGGTWTYRDLAQYLHNPRASVPGTSMAFAGIIDNQRMANLLAYMRTRADRPAPLPN